jgi:EAL domain-containing protein (putative c-di-GMP-specific phosphodiesterase class I)
VESVTQAEALRTIGCSLAQGYELGRPADTETTRRTVLDAARVTG